MISKRAALAALTAIAALGQANAPAIAASGVVFYSFNGGGHGSEPVARLFVDSSGNLDGTTLFGGRFKGRPCFRLGCGTVFQVSPNGHETVLHRFKVFGDGQEPEGGLIADADGNLYGTTTGGGGKKHCCGTVFELSSTGVETLLHVFSGGSDGAEPIGELIVDKSGNLFGTTWVGGGSANCADGCGTVFEISPDHSEKVLHVFAGGSDGALPRGGLIIDSAGNLFGTTSEGGNTGCPGNYGCGIIYKLAPDGTETLLHVFSDGKDGALPVGGLIVDTAGDFYGTASAGGGTSCYGGLGCGTIFKMASNGQLTVLYAFQGGSDGYAPNAPLLEDGAGNFYGTAAAGGGRGCVCGTVFELTAAGSEETLYPFAGQPDGDAPYGGLVADGNGNLYGITISGGSGGKYCTTGVGCGTVFKVKP